MIKLNLSKLLKEQVVPVMGCTEPASIALACAAAASVLNKHAYNAADGITKIELTLDRFVYRNAKSVGIPGSGGLTGIKIAAAMGTFCNPGLGLNIFHSFDKKNICAAERLSKN